MTRKELTGTRDLTFSGWIRANLPDSYTGFRVSDLDFILWNCKTRSLMLLEVKTRGKKMAKWQSSLFCVLDMLIKKGLPDVTPPIHYKGFHCVRFIKTWFDDGVCMLNKKQVTEKQLMKFLSMKEP
jgi:hypothetical protein